MSLKLIAPAMALVIWTLVMLIWMVAMRLPAINKAGVKPAEMRGGRGTDLDRLLPGQVNWPAHNYEHLMEQPTIFYATIFALVLLGQDTALNVGLAWTYVGLRIVHSIWQAAVNTIPVRANLFFISSAVLLVMAVNGFVAALG